MILRPSFANGFAPRDGRAIWPELWRGCVGAWNPGLGPTGLGLYDWSPYKNHGTLTNMEAGNDWVTSQGRYALDFDGVNDYVGFVSPGNAPDGGPQSLSLWFNARGIVVADRPQLFGLGQSSSPFISTMMMGFNIIGNAPTEGTSRLCFVDYSGIDVSGAFTTQAFGTQLNRWFHACGAWTGYQWQLWVNGVSDTNAQWVQDAPESAVSNRVLAIGSSGTSRYFDGQISDVAIYNRALNPNEIRLLATRPGIAYEMAPRRWSAQMIDAYRRRTQQYQQLVGGGVI